LLEERGEVRCIRSKQAATDKKGNTQALWVWRHGHVLHKCPEGTQRSATRGPSSPQKLFDGGEGW